MPVLRNIPSAVPLEARAHPNVVIVALANKLARTAWVVLQRGAEYDGRLLANA